MQSGGLDTVCKSAQLSLYKMAHEGKVDAFIATTPETRTICNDPFCYGMKYTDKLAHACGLVLEAFRDNACMKLEERKAIVFHVLRGGLNWGLREACAHGLGWNCHGSAFISAQRARQSPNSEEWLITESTYKKVYLPDQAIIILGDVVATGVSLTHALKELCKAAQEQKKTIQSILMFTYGGPRAAEILHTIEGECNELFPDTFKQCALVYMEGCFPVPTPETPLSVKVTGTDLIRVGATMAPEFIESQYEKPSFPLERCTIYDAGSRAFWVPEYFQDVLEYWESCLKLAEGGMTFEELLKERFPTLEANRFGQPDLKRICEEQIAHIKVLL